MSYSETNNRKKMYVTFHSKDEIMNFVTVCNKFDDSIDIKDNKTLIDAKSVMGMLILKLDIPYEIVYECFDDEDNYEEFLSAVVDRYSIDLT